MTTQAEIRAPEAQQMFVANPSCPAPFPNEQYIRRCVENAEQLAEACAAYVRARNDGGVSMADLSTIADTKIRAALAQWEARHGE